MSNGYINKEDAIKHTIRNLKKTEIRVRFSSNEANQIKGQDLVWSNFFDLKEPYAKNAKYNLSQLCNMDKLEYKSVIEEFYWNVYYRLFKDNYYSLNGFYEGEALKKLGLPPFADVNDIKAKFRQLAKKHHPDLGGNKEEFIEIYKIYNELKNQY